jgi:hypothetical protein
VFRSVNSIAILSVHTRAGIQGGILCWMTPHEWPLR